MSFKDTQRRLVMEGRAKGMKWRDIADKIWDATGIRCSHDGLRRTANRAGWTKGLKGISTDTLPDRTISKKYEKDIGEVTTKSLDIRTLEDALSYAEVDLEV